MFARLCIGLLSFAGLLISSYFAAVFHQWSSDADRFVPRFCRMEPGTCSTILETRQARLFGVPNFDLAILFYIALVVSVLIPDVWRQLRTMLLFGTMIAVATGIYLSHALLFRLKVHCGLCFTSHAINLVILLFILETP